MYGGVCNGHYGVGKEGNWWFWMGIQMGESGIQMGGPMWGIEGLRKRGNMREGGMGGVGYNGRIERE